MSKYCSPHLSVTLNYCTLFGNRRGLFFKPWEDEQVRKAPREDFITQALLPSTINENVYNSYRNNLLKPPRLLA